MKKLIFIFIILAVIIGCNSSTVFGQISFSRYDSIALAPDLNQTMIAIDDMDNDQQKEIISMYSSFGASNSLITISKWLPGGSMLHTDYYIPYQNIRNFTTLDGNSDGRKDIAFVCSDLSVVLLQDSSGTFNVNNQIISFSGSGADGISKGDFNNDGKDDYVCSNWGDEHLSLFLQTSWGYTETDILAIQAGYNQVKVYDVNQDSWDDIVFLAGQGLSSGIYVYINENGFFTSPPFYFPVLDPMGNTLITSSVCFGDFFGNGPGLMINSSNGGPDDTRFIQNQAPTWVNMGPVNVLPYFPSAVVADFDNNGIDEAVYLANSIDNLQILYFSSLLSNSTTTFQTIGGNYHAFDQMLAVGDVVGNDGKSDLVMISDWGQVLILKNTTTMTGIRPPPSDPQIKIYPNPTTDYLNVSLDDAGENHCTISDISGRIVLEKTYHGQNFKIDLQGIPTGIYFLRINGKQSFSRKFIVR